MSGHFHHQDRIAAAIDRNKQTPNRTSESNLFEIPPDITRISKSLSNVRNESALDHHDPYFSSIISPDSIKDDDSFLEYANRKIQESNTENDKRVQEISSAFEYVLTQRINEGLLGPTIRAQLASELDDKKHQIDAYVEDIAGEVQEPLGLSMDITFSSNENVLKTKLNHLLDFHIKRGSLPKLKYYKPLGTNKTQQPTKNTELDLPKVIIGVSRDSAFGALRNFDAKKPVGELDPTLSKIVLRQIEIQLNAFCNYSSALHKQKGLPSLERAAAAYKKAHHFIQARLDAQLGLPESASEEQRTKARKPVYEEMLKDKTSKVIMELVGDL